MPDTTRRTGVEQAISEEGAPESEMPEQLSVGKKQWYVERDIAEIRKELKEGSRTFAGLRTDAEDQRKATFTLQREVENKVESVRRDLEGKDLTNRRELETLIATQRREIDTRQSAEMQKVSSDFKLLEDSVNPRASMWKVAGWIAVFVIPSVIAIGSWLWSGAKYPDRDEYRELAEKIERKEGDLESRLRQVEKENIELRAVIDTLTATRKQP